MPRLMRIASKVRTGTPATLALSAGRRSATKVTRAAMLTRNVSVYSTKVMPAFTFTAQEPNSSSLSPLPPLPSTTQRITSRYIAETIATVRTTSQMLAPNVTSATPAERR